MKVVIIDGSLHDYVDGNEKGVISISEPCQNKALDIADKFLDYGKTVVLELSEEGE